MGADKLITIAINTFARANLIKSLLESEGINCYLKNANLIQSAISSGVKVRIHERDVEKATKVLMRLQMEEEQKKEVNTSKKILLPIDDFNVKPEELNLCLEIAEKLEAEVNLLYVFFPQYLESVPITDAYTAQINLNLINKEKEEEVKQQIDTFKTDVEVFMNGAGIHNVNISTTIVQGEWADTILDAADEMKVDLITLFLRTTSSFSLGLTESINKEIIEYANAPVLVVPRQSDVTSLKNLTKLVYVTDFDETDFANIKRLIVLLGGIPCEIHCLHVGDNEIQSYTKARMDGLKEYFNSLYEKIHVNCVNINHQDKVQVINEYIEKEQINALSMTTHKHDLITRIFYPSAAQKLLYHTHIPMLIYHA